MKNSKPQKSFLSNFLSGNSLLYGFIIILSLVIIVPYIIHWGSFTISDKQDDWSFFASYFSDLANPLFLIVTIFLTIHFTNENSKQYYKTKLNEDIRLVIKEQDIEIENQINREVYIYGSNPSEVKLVKIRDALSLPAHYSGGFSLDSEMTLKIETLEYYKGIIHNLYNLKELIQSLNIEDKDNMYIQNYYKRKNAFLLETFLRDKSLCLKYIKISDDLYKMAIELSEFYKTEQWD
jgi:hypothetical protein